MVKIKKTFIIFGLLLILLVLAWLAFFTQHSAVNNKSVVQDQAPADKSGINISDIVPSAINLAESVPGIKLDMNALSPDQISIIEMVNQRSTQGGGSQAKGKVVTEIWQIFNEKNHYKVVLTSSSKNIFSDKSPIYYDVKDGKIIGTVSSSGVMSTIGANIFTSKEQDAFIKDCLNQINTQNKLIKNFFTYGPNNNLNKDNTVSFTFKDKTECTCLAIGCCDDFKPITTEYSFVCHLNLDNSLTLDSMPVKNY